MSKSKSKSTDLPVWNYKFSLKAAQILSITLVDDVNCVLGFGDEVEPLIFNKKALEMQNIKVGMFYVPSGFTVPTQHDAPCYSMSPQLFVDEATFREHYH